MSYKVIYHPLLHEDIQDAVDWYNEQQEKLGNELYSNIKIQIQKIIENPFAFSLKYKKTRSALVSKFPYAIHYYIDQKEKVIFIKAVFHTSRSPKIWKKR